MVGQSWKKGKNDNDNENQTKKSKQTSYAAKNDLNLAEALQGPYILKAEGSFNSKVQPSLALLVTSRPFTLYQETPYASIPVSDVELVACATEHYHEPVSVGGKISRISVTNSTTPRMPFRCLVLSPRGNATRCCLLCW